MTALALKSAPRRTATLAVCSKYAAVFRSVETAADHRRAKAAISELMDARPGSAESLLLRALATLVDAYERRLRPPPAALDPVAVVEFYMEQGVRSQTDLASVIGANRASELLNRKRNELSIGEIRKLRDAWHIPAGMLVG